MPKCCVSAIVFCCLAVDDDGKFVPVVAFECRGLEPIKYQPEVGAWCMSIIGDWFVLEFGLCAIRRGGAGHTY